MMYIEDLAVLSESFIQKKDFYELLIDGSISIGRLTGDFVRDIPSFSDERISKIMNYAQPNSISSVKESVKLLSKLLKYHIDKTKNNLLRVTNFSSEANHLLYKRFKHAGMPILPNTLQTHPKSGLDPFRDVILLPYSKGILGRYEKIVGILQNVLREMVGNRKICLERNIDGMIPPEFSSDIFTSDERSLIQTRFNEFYNIHPILDVPKMIEYNLDKETSQKMLEKIRWYLQKDT
jgi:hypothetical protein